MTPDQIEHFYEAALIAGAILTGFNGTFLSFRIQREANYYRQPVATFKEGSESGRGQDAYIGLSHFTSSFFLIIVGALCSAIFGVLLPLSALAHWDLLPHSPACVLAGIIASAALVAGYFFDELFHYEIIKLNRLWQDVLDWKWEWAIVVASVLLAAAFWFLTYCTVH